MFGFSTALTAEAAGEGSYTYYKEIEEYSGSTHSFAQNEDGYKRFVDYCYYYNTNNDFAKNHKGDTLSIVFPELSEVYGFMGLGNSTYPFAGTIQFIASDGVSNISLPRALFTYVSTDAKLMNANGSTQTTLKITKNSTLSSPLLADHVCPGLNAADWKITVDSANTNAFAGVFGQLEENANVELQFNNESSAAVSNTAGENDIKDVGELCGIMKTGSSLTVTCTATVRPAVSSTSGNAGSLVGTMEGTAALTLNNNPNFSAVSVTSNNGYAGGLVGKMTSEATITVKGLASSLSVGGTVTGTTGAGGLFGHYTNSTAGVTFDLAGYIITAAVYAQNCGGVFGVLENNKGTSETPVELTIMNTSNAETVNVSSGSDSTYADSGYFGGIAGKYMTDDLKNSLILGNFSVTSTANAQFDSFGGVIGIVDSAAYVKADGLKVSSNYPNKKNNDSFFGGLVGKTSDTTGVFIDLGDFSLTASSFNGGGVVGSFKNGVLRLSGITDMASANASRGGQLVGANDNVLVYALGTGIDGIDYEEGWSFKRSQTAALVDDLGTWGEVVRQVNNGSGNQNIEQAHIVSVGTDSDLHKVTLTAAVTSGMSNSDEFARTALNIMLNINKGNTYGDLFVFDNASASSTLLGSELSVDGSINLTGTGINGFMRDGGDLSAIGSFTGTLKGGSNTVTLAAGESYGLDSTGVAVSTNEGTGQIYRHQHNGLFAVLAGTVENLIVDGTINVRNRESDVDNNVNAAMNIGGIASRSGGNVVTLTGVTTNVTVNYHESENINNQQYGKNIGGYIGYVGADGNIIINGVSTIGATFNLSGHHEYWNVYGGAIGKITAESFQVIIGAVGDANNKLTDSLTTDITGITNVGTNGDGGGLIGYITDTGNHGSRVVNLNNLEFNDCIVGNAASTNGGGFLGYAWLKTTTNINGVTVTGSSKIMNQADSNKPGDVGVMLYSSTGRMKIDSLAISGLSMSEGAGTSLGMIVNKAYDGNDGLYLDVLNAGYTLTGSGISLPSSLGVYDELAAYSASNVINGGNGAGVVSVNMNSTREGSEAKITVTGTYQNQLTSASSSALVADKYANGNSRYYYNLDVLNNSDAGQNLLLWSLNKYAAPNIAAEFMKTETHTFGTTFETTLRGEADLSGLSFYPLANAGDYTLDGLKLTFDYSGIYSTDETTFSNSVTSDDYIRDPGANNQHYLMHSGLFINLPAENTITVSGASSIGGNFLEVGAYQAALISGTMNGNLKVTGSLELKGLTPKTTGNAAYADGYLLVHQISRPDNQTQTITMELQNISTSGYSKDGQTAVAKSLIGPAQGRGLNFKFSGIKLDARKAVVADTDTVSGVNDALTTAYGTSGSIFSKATLVYSICTDQYANLIYNFTRDEDWGADGNGSRNVTYGNEITNSLEYPGQEKQYYGDPRNFIRPDSDSNTEYTFSADVFLPYVCAPYDPNGDHTDKYFREIKVNVVTAVVWNGCGTYNDPYIINDARQLETLSMFLQSGNASILGSIILPIYDALKFNGISNNTTGNRWCTDKTGGKYHVLYTNNGDTEFTATDKEPWPAENVQYYLAGAYYKIAASFELGSNFIGLGGTDQNTAFRGVIVGEKDETGSPKYTITNTTDKPFIRVTNGCVIKDINISVDDENDISIAQGNNGYNNAYFGYDYNNSKVCKFYGGIIGEIMGGDNIIDNSYVTFADSSKITLSGNNGTIVPVGGYVGVVVFGGLIFKNMDARKTTLDSTNLNVIYTKKTYNLADNSGKEAWAAIYVNPIVGRVINGYAVNETGGKAKGADGNTVQQFSQSENETYHDEDGSTRENVTQHTLKNGKKHYSIADLDPRLDKLDVENVPANTLNDGIINIPNSQAMFILSLITQSTAGTAQDKNGDYINSLSYGTVSSTVYGMSHNADYSAVGTSEEDSAQVDDYMLASKDTAANAAVPYIITRYTKKIEDINEIEISILEDVYICNKRYPNDEGTWYLSNTVQSNNNLKHTAKDNAKLFTLARVNSGPYQGMYVFYYLDANNVKNYLWFNDGNDYNLRISTVPDYFNLTYIEGDGVWRISDNIDSSRYLNNSTNRYTGYNVANDPGNQLLLIDEDNKSLSESDINSIQGTNDTISIEIIEGGYNSRCVTSTLGYYDINLTGSDYVLPDSFRGLGSVGLYDSKSPDNDKQVEPSEAEGGQKNNGTSEGWNNRATNMFSIKLDTFAGKSCIIDIDIYLNKYLNDNYFNRLHSGTKGQKVNEDTSEYNKENNNNKQMHGIGLFDSVITKNDESSFSDFTLSGSVHTQVFSNDYKTSNQEAIDANTTAGQYVWLSTGGVCGWGINGLWMKFSNVQLNNLSVRGATTVGGLLASSGNKSKTYYITCEECSATNLKINLSVTTSQANRAGIGAFVGKVKEGGVRIYGTALGKDNTDTSKYSVVDISSFKSIDNNSVISGGLVGYAGNGCQVYDMHVKATSGSSVTIGGSNVNMAGGIAGLMQPVERYLEDCKAEFVRCQVQNIDVKANLYAGGLYGGTWNTGDDGWVPYVITIDSCEVIGFSTSSRNEISATSCAGGFVADGLVYSGALPNIEIKNSKISNYNISNNSQANYVTNQTVPVGVGGFIGFARAQKSDANVTCYIHDSSVENCMITAKNAKGYAGGAIGQIANKNSDATGNRMLGYNIRLDNVTSDSPDRMGAWVGNLNTSDSTTSIQFAGLAIYENGFTKNVGNRDDFTNASFVFAAYDKNMLEEGDNNSVPDVSELNKGTTVGMPEKPYVNINPQSSMGTGEIITGDGAVLRSKASQTTDYKGKTAEKTMALKIYEDIVADEDSRRYTTFGAYNNTDAAKINGGSKIDEYMQRTTVDDGDRISTYYTEKGITYHPDYADFACVVIANNTTEETTALINRYAQLVTNTTTDYAGTDSSNDYFNIVVKSCKFEKENENENGKFVVDSSATPGLNYLNGQFSLNGLSADSRSDGDTFTLVDIQFMDPLTAGLDNEKKKIAYHLYIPVYTIKEIEVTFQATVLNGTNSVSYDAAGTENTNGYAAKLNKTASDTHVDNLNTWFTTYIRYTYSRDDLQALLDSGNLNWNHNKYFYLDKTGYDATRLLPSDTYMVLVDPNGDHDKQYQVLLNDADFARVNNRISFDLTKFKDRQGIPFTVSTFNEMIAKKIIATETAGNYNLYNGTPSNTGSQHYVYTKAADGTLTYYEYVGSGGAYNLTLPEDYELNENYYISMYVPGAENSNDLYGYYIRTPEKFDAPRYTAGTNNAITKSAKINCHYGSNTTTSNRQVYIGNLFDQTTVLTVKPDDLEIDTGNKTLNIYAATTITPKNANVTAILNSINPSIYHSFNLFLDRKGENGLTTNDIYGLSNDGTDIQAWYSIGTQIPMDPNASMTGFTSIARDNIDLQENYINVTTTNSVSPNGVTIYSRVKLDFSAEGIMNEFPQRVTNDTGVSVRAASNLAYDSASLAFSSMSAPAEEPVATKHIYYRQSLDTASLNYYAKTEHDSYDTDGLSSENLSRLGVNGRYSMNDYMPVNSTAQYNISSIESAAEDAEKLSLTLTLQKKTDTPTEGPYSAATYQNVSNINSYWGAVQRDGTTHEVIPNTEGKPVTVDNTTNVHIKCGNYDAVIKVPADSTSIQLKIPKNTSETPGYLVDENGYIYINVGFNAKTGENFTEYANYKVNLSVRLLDGSDKEITGSYASDYLIYTNAKVNHDFLKDN